MTIYAGYEILVPGKSRPISETVFPNFGEKDQSPERLEELALQDIGFASKRYGRENVQIRFIGHTPLDARLQPNLYKSPFLE